MTRIALLNVKYSPNLGDGVIAECLEHELRRLHPEWTVTSVDLAGRSDFSADAAVPRARAIQILGSLPRVLRPIVAAAALRTLVQFSYRRSWRRQLNGVSGAILGGGQLIADADLNFPIKISGILGEVKRSGAALAVFGVGTAHQLSARAVRMLGTAFKSWPPVHVAVRDDASKMNWDKHFAGFGIPEAKTCRDPGLLARNVYAVSRRRGSAAKPAVGVGIVDPRTLNLHSSRAHTFAAETALKFWVELCERLEDQGCAVTLFTNGPSDDEKFLETVHGAMSGRDVRKAPPPETPHALAATVAGMDAVVAHRLHANILAYSFKVPHVGLSWDPKVAAFLGSVGRSHFFANPFAQGPVQIASLVSEAMEEGIDDAAHTAVLAETQTAIARCVNDLCLEGRLSSDTDRSQVEDALGVRPAS